MDDRPIGVFDSGIGGLSVLAQIIKVVPNEKYIYYADTDNVPYGIKTNEEIKEYVKEAMDFFISKNVKAVVIACNTATSIAIEETRQSYNIPVIGIEPAAKPAVENRKDKKVLLMATPVTVREEKLKRLLKKVDLEKSVDLLAMPELVKFAEKEEFDSTKVEQYIKEQTAKYNLDEYSELVLGCTHFPFFKPVFKKLFPENVQIIDGGYGVAKRLKQILSEKNMEGSKKTPVEYYYSGRKIVEKTELKKMERLLKRI